MRPNSLFLFVRKTRNRFSSRLKGAIAVASGAKIPRCQRASARVTPNDIISPLFRRRWHFFCYKVRSRAEQRERVRVTFFSRRENSSHFSSLSVQQWLIDHVRERAGSRPACRTRPPACAVMINDFPFLPSIIINARMTSSTLASGATYPLVITH